MQPVPNVLSQQNIVSLHSGLLEPTFCLHVCSISYGKKLVRNRSKRLDQASWLRFHLVSSKMVDYRPMSSQIAYVFNVETCFFQNASIIFSKNGSLVATQAKLPS